MSQTPLAQHPTAKQPWLVLENIFAFPPNRDTLGATAYFIVENQTRILIDCPAWDETNQAFLRHQGGIDWLVITHRGGIGKAQEIQQATGCGILIQEQEAYLLPGLRVTTFPDEFTLSPHCRGIWTPGHSPGSSCFYDSRQGGVLFTGRHLLPNLLGQPMPLRLPKTFHWPRQLRSVQLLLDQFNAATLSYLCPGANTGPLRGKRVIEDAYQKIASLDLKALLP